MPERVVLSFHPKPETKQRLDALARVTKRSQSSLANEALEQYLAHQEWLTLEIERAVAAAKAGELINDRDVEAWFRSIGVAD